MSGLADLVEVAHLHCQRDVGALIDAGTIGAELMPEFADLELQVSDLASGSRLLQWNSNNLTFALKRLTQGSALVEVLTILRPDIDRSAGDAATKEIEASVQPEARSRLPCLGFLWRVFFQLAYVMPMMAIPIAGVSILAIALFQEPVGILTFIVLTIGVVPAYSVWGRRRRFRYLTNAWRREFTEGDQDGSVRRALHSIGVTL